MLNKRIKLIEDFDINKENDVFVITNAKNNKLLVTNEIGKFIIDNDGKTINEIINIVHEKFKNIEVETIHKDVLEFIDDCEEKGVLKID